MTVVHVVDVLIEDSADDERQRSEHEVVQRDKYIIEDSLAGKAGVESEEQLRDREYPSRNKQGGKCLR